MNCHDNCAACCIAPTITSALPNMPNGKPAGIPCVNLDENLRCIAYNQRPSVCRGFQPSDYSCGSNHEQALELISALEIQTN